MNNLISIIMPSFNSSKTIIESIESIISQRYDNWELLVTDDCSTDDTVSIVEKYAEKDLRIKLFYNHFNSGAAVSRNNSMNNAKGDYIAFLDSDDLWLPNKLSEQLLFMNKHDADFVFTAYEIIDESGTKTGNVVDLQGEQLSFSYVDMLHKKATLGCSTVMFRKTAFKDYQMPLIRTGQDYALWLKLLKEGHRAYLINKVLTQYRILPNSISRNKFKKCKRQWQIYRELENLNLYDSARCFTHYALRAVFRK